MERRIRGVLVVTGLVLIVAGVWLAGSAQSSPERPDTAEFCATEGLFGGQTYIRRSTLAPVICWIDVDARLGCWPPALEELPDFPAGEFVTVRVGMDHLCARRASGEVACWGWGDCGQGECDSPQGEFTYVRVGVDANCARRADGQVECWGEPDLEGEQ